MARFCTSCGSDVAEDLKFCSKCGTPVAAATPPAPPTAPRPAAPPTPTAGAPAATQPRAAKAGPPAPAKKPSSPVVKIILIVVLVIVFIMIASIGACVYVGYRAKKAVDEAVKMDGNGTTIEIPTPGGAIKLGGPPKETPEEIGGVPVYPGAQALESGAQLSFGDQFQLSGQEFETDDTVDEVVAFYKEKYTTNLMTVESQGHFRMSVNTGTEDEPHVVTIDVSSDADTGKTKIFMSHMGGKEMR